MTTVNSNIFSQNPIHYLDLAITDNVVVERGDYKFRIALDMPRPQEILAPDEDLRNAITMEELKEKVLVMIDRLDQKYARK